MWVYPLNPPKMVPTPKQRRATHADRSVPSIQDRSWQQHRSGFLQLHAETGDVVIESLVKQLTERRLVTMAFVGYDQAC